jgi:DNA methylase
MSFRRALWALAVVVCLAAPVAVQAQGDYLDVYIVKVKPEKLADFQALTKKWADANRRFNGDRWLALETVYGEGNVYQFTSTRKDYADIDKTNEAVMAAVNKAFGKAAADKMGQDFNNCLVWSRAELRRRRWDLSRKAPQGPEAYAKFIGESRFLRTTAVHIRPGHVTEFEALAKEMKEANRGKQMKSVLEIYPPEAWEKKFGKHPTQKPVALLERILLASSNEGDLVLDPFSGSGTTLLAAFRLRRHALGCELSAEFLTLSLRRICSNLVQVDLSLTCVQFSLDPLPDPMDRSFCSAGFQPARMSSRAKRGICFSPRNSDLSPQLQLVQQERRFYFIGRTDRRVIFTVLADSLDEARQKFRASGRPDSDALFIIKTETEIYLA